MRYHYEKPENYTSMYGQTYECDHPVYARCTLFKIDGMGLAVIQQRYDPKTKTTWWTEIDPWLVDDLYLCPNFYQYFEERARTCSDGIYPTVTIRQKYSMEKALFGESLPSAIICLLLQSALVYH